VSAEFFVVGLAALVLLASIGIAVTSWVVSARLSDELADLRDKTTRICQSLERRLAALERLEEPSRPAAAGSTPKRSMQESGGAGLTRVRQTGAPLRHPSGPPVTVSQDADRPTSPPQPPSIKQVLEEAAGALASAAAFNAFAARFRGQGYVLEEGSPSTLPTGATPDRADLHVLTYADGRLVLPGFNLRRAQGLLTSDEGRAAEAKLGWLFEIEQGQAMRATRGAIVERDGWTVRGKGRLTIPL
jgi:hypothetical protein